MRNKKVYLGLAADIIHDGHIELLEFANKLGEVTVGLLTDKAIASYKNLPYLNYEKRFKVVKNLRFVNNIIPQYTLDYTSNLKKIKPDIVVHGDDWRTGVQKKTREKVIKILKLWNGKLIEKKYKKGISSTQIRKKILEVGTLSSTRKERFTRLLLSKDYLRVLECHNPLGGIIIENLSIKKNKFTEQFDCMWSSSLADSISRGMPDNQSVDYSTRINGINEIFNVTTKPLIFDIDNGGDINHLGNLSRRLENSGVSAVIIEDKIGLKINSLFSDQSLSRQDTIKNFCNKIQKIKKNTLSEDFFVVARIESFILNKPLSDAIKRAEAYSKAGADFIMIHSKSKSPKEIISFAKAFKKSRFYKPLVCVPSTYSVVSEKILVKHGFKIIIYANQLLRASYNAMKKATSKILKDNRAYQLDKQISSIKEILDLI